MITIIVLLVAAGAVAFLVRSIPLKSLGRGERLYVFVSPVPLFLAIALPAALVLLGEESSSTTLRILLGTTGVWLSIGSALVGLVIIGRNYVRTGLLDQRLIMALFLASIPALLLLLVNVLFLLLRG